MISPVTLPENPVSVAVHVDAVATAKLVNVHAVPIAGAAKVRVVIPELARLLASVGYDAVTVTSPAAVPLTVTEHVPPAEREQVKEEKEIVPGGVPGV